MLHNSSKYDRRSLLKRIGVGAVALTAGCTGSSDSGGSGGDTASDSGTEDDTGGSSNPDVTMTIASTFEPEHVQVKAAQNFKSAIEAETDGAFSVEISPGGAYGSEDEIGEIVSQGGVEAHSAGSFPYFQYAREYWFFGNPFVISDYDQLVRVLESDEMQAAQDELIENGNQRPIGTQLYRGQRHFTSNKPIRTPDDVQGLNLRLPELDPWVQIWESIGASPTPVALDELYTALDTGTADASEGGVSQIHSFNLSEVQSHLSLTNHLVANGNLYINEDFYQGLDETYQDLVTELGAKATQEASKTAMEQEQGLIDSLEDAGMTVVEDVDQEAFQKAAEPAIKDLFESTWASDWETIQGI